MQAEKINQLGKIRISEAVFSQLAKRAIDKTHGDAWLSTAKGRIIDTNVFVAAPDYSQAFELKVINGKLHLTIYIVCTFGKSIKLIARKVTDQLHSDISIVYSKDVAQIKVCITGIKSKKFAKRYLEVIENYESK